MFRLLSAFVLLVLSVTASAQDSAALRREASRLYSEGMYADAAQLYAEIAAVETGAVDALINAAHAYAETDDLGHAMLYYRRAQLLLPRDSAVQYGLALIRALRVDVLPDDSSLLPALERLTAEVVSEQELAWLTLLAWSAAFGLTLYYVLRRRGKWTAAASVIIAALLLILMVARAVSVRGQPPVVVTAFEEALLSGPGTEYVHLATVYAAAEGRLLDTRDGWRLIALSDGRIGWLPDESVSLLVIG